MILILLFRELNLDRHDIVVDPGELPACGYKVFKVVSTRQIDRRQALWWEPRPEATTIAVSPRRLENDLIAVTMNANGTFDLEDKATGALYGELNYYEDTAEFGDYWTNARPDRNRTFNSLGSAARIWIEENGPLQATIASEITMRLPARGDRPASRRSSEEKDLTIVTRVTVRRGSPEVDVRVSFDNQIADHRLRAMFPTNLATSEVDAGGHFSVERRPVRIPRVENDGQVLDEMQTQPHQNFIDLADGRRGLAFMNDSLTEYQVLDDPERTVALTLLRACKNEICAEFRVVNYYARQDGGQSFGKHELRYVLVPHAGDWLAAAIDARAERLNTPLPWIQTSFHAGTLPASEAELFAVAPGELRIAAVKHAEDRPTAIVRVYSVSEKAVEGALRFHQPVRAAWETNLNEERKGKLKVDGDGEVAITVAPHKIVTVEVEFAK